MDADLKTYLEAQKKDFEEKSNSYYLKYKNSEIMAKKIGKFLENNHG